MRTLVTVCFGLLLLLGSLFVISVSKSTRETVFNRIGIYKRSSKGQLYQTIEKHGQPSNEVESNANCSDVLPPSRRHMLEQLSPSDANLAKNFERFPLDYSKQVPDKETIEEHHWADHVTPTGFTVEEIKQLGDFPDYAKLSGVPLPSAYTDFDLTLAEARPYRPLRWGYYQTMGICIYDNISTHSYANLYN